MGIGKDRYTMLVCTKANPEKEAEYNKWYDEHVTLLFGYKNMKRVNRYHYFRPLGPTGDNSPEYMTAYEFESKEAMQGLQQSSQMKAAITDFEEKWSGLGELLWSGWYEPVKTMERSSVSVKKSKTAGNIYLEIVGSGPKPGKKTEYLDYYVGHFTKMFEYKGIQRVSYGRIPRPQSGSSEKCPPYLTVYEFESKEAMDAFYQDPVFTDAGKDWEEIGKGAMDLRWCAEYEAIKTLER